MHRDVTQKRLTQGRIATGVYIGYIYPPKISQTQSKLFLFLWRKNDVRTVLEHEY